jgi:SP family general alpha glucoside:H+ symporter-like MFS transporter
MSCTIIMESYDVFLMGNFVALPAFTKDYGIWNELKQEYVVAPAWQSALQGMFP